jgi:hypothetical protein
VEARVKASEEDLATLKQATPYVRSALAFLLFMRFGLFKGVTPEDAVAQCYAGADMFLQRLHKDLRE